MDKYATGPTRGGRKPRKPRGKGTPKARKPVESAPSASDGQREEGRCAYCSREGLVEFYRGVPFCVYGPNKCIRHKATLAPKVAQEGGRGELPPKRKGLR